jgi:uroporphyrinogen-III synthase
METSALLKAFQQGNATQIKKILTSGEGVEAFFPPLESYLKDQLIELKKKLKAVGSKSRRCRWPGIQRPFISAKAIESAMPQHSAESL